MDKFLNENSCSLVHDDEVGKYLDTKGAPIEEWILYNGGRQTPLVSQPLPNRLETFLLFQPAV